MRVVIQVLGPRFAEKLEEIEAPKRPRSPRYDMRISRKGGYQWASETDLEGLRWWLHRFQSSAAEGGKFADKDAKKAEKLAYWVDWREAYPDPQWTGMRNDDAVTAPVPVAKPPVYEWEPRGQMPLTPRDEPYDGAEDEIPF
jgi:hypothetical protein